MHVLVLVDDKELGRVLADALGSSGHSLVWCQHGAVDHFSHIGADIVVVDVGQFGRDELTNLARLRRLGSAPLLVLVPDGDQVGLEQAMWHADEYLTKPVNPKQLRQQVEQAVHKAAVRTKRVVKAMDVMVDFEARAVWVRGFTVSLTAKEYKVLAVLANHAGHAVSRRGIEDAVWGADLPDSSRALDVHMATLRAKINRPGLIQTVRGFGYRFGDPLGGPKADPPSTPRQGTARKFRYGEQNGPTPGNRPRIFTA